MRDHLRWAVISSTSLLGAWIAWATWYVLYREAVFPAYLGNLLGQAICLLGGAYGAYVGFHTGSYLAGKTQGLARVLWIGFHLFVSVISLIAIAFLADVTTQRDITSSLRSTYFVPFFYDLNPSSSPATSVYGSILVVSLPLIIIAWAVISTLVLVWPLGRQNKNARLGVWEMPTPESSAIGDDSLDDGNGSAAKVEDLPGLPSELLKACRLGRAVLVVGPEFPKLRERPGRIEVMFRLVNEPGGRPISKRTLQSVIDGLEKGDSETAADLLRTKFDKISPNSSHTYLHERIARLYQGGRPSHSYKLLGNLNLTAVINMSWDPETLNIFADRELVELRPDSQTVLEAMRSHSLPFVWLLGDPSSSENIFLTLSEVRRTLYENETLAKFLSGLEQSSILVFLGAKVDDIEKFFDSLPPSRTRAKHQARNRHDEVSTHFAIVEKDALWEIHREKLPRKLGVELIGYDTSHQDGLAVLIDRLVSESRSKGVTVGGLTERRRFLTRIRCENIGVFEELDLKLNRGWNLLLGNNGCGKSTVLRAVALGLCGDHPRATEAGESLLRVGMNTGSIELWVGNSMYRTELSRVGGTVRVYSTALTPLQQGTWAVLGFPALRGVSLSAPTGTSRGQSGQPHVNDLLPLLLGEIDPRLDDLKQWVINVEARTHQGDSERWRKLLATFFDVLGDLTPGLDVTFHSINRDSWDVLVQTDDGIVPIDQLSQGMNSILSWVGTVLQRMCDIYPDSKEPSSESAFVLIDEIDAHLHPTWQRLLPNLVRSHFSNVQFLATSHSPLLAGGLESEEILIARREPAFSQDRDQYSVACITPADFETEGLRADQILTSPLFGLVTTRDVKEQQDIREYSRLLGLEKRSDEEQERFNHLQQRIESWMWTGESEALREREKARAQAIKHEETAGLAERFSKDEAREKLSLLKHFLPEDEEEKS